METLYIVKYSQNDLECGQEVIIFATPVKSRATKYATRFNKILKKWQNHYSQYEHSPFPSFIWLKDEHIKYINRWSSLRETSKCYWEEVEVR